MTRRDGCDGTRGVGNVSSGSRDKLLNCSKLNAKFYVKLPIKRDSDICLDFLTYWLRYAKFLEIICRAINISWTTNLIGPQIASAPRQEKLNFSGKVTVSFDNLVLLSTRAVTLISLITSEVSQGGWGYVSVTCISYLLVSASRSSILRPQSPGEADRVLKPEILSPTGNSFQR